MKKIRDLNTQATRTTFSILAILATGFIFSAPAIAEESCTQLLTNRCETCHYMTRVCQKVERESSKKKWPGGVEGTWKRTMKNMVKQGAKLNKEEEKILVECLSRPTPEVLNICKLGK